MRKQNSRTEPQAISNDEPVTLQQKRAWFAQFFEDMGKANSATHGVSPTIGGWHIP